MARPQDLDGIAQCLASAFAPYRRSYTAPAYAATVLTGAGLLRRMRRMWVLVAVGSSAGVVGTVSMRRAVGAHVHLRGMAVRPDWQGQGVAGRLLRRALAEARTVGAVRVTLETTLPLDRAMRFYERHGFRRTGKTRRWGGMRLIGYELRWPAPALRP